MRRHDKGSPGGHARRLFVCKHAVDPDRAGQDHPARLLAAVRQPTGDQHAIQPFTDW